MSFPTHWSDRKDIDEKWLKEFLAELKRKRKRDIELMNRSKRLYHQGKSAFSESELTPQAND